MSEKSQGSLTMPEAMPEIIVTSNRRVSCDGGGGALGHPKVYMDMGQNDFVQCKYCDRRYVLEGGH